MGPDRFVVLGVARARSEWFREVAHWGHSAALPIEFVKAVSVDEVRVRLRSGRSYSALLIDSASHGLDRDLVDLAIASGCAVVLVGGSRRAGGIDLGVSAQLATAFSRDELLAVLRQVATPVTAAPVGVVDPDPHGSTDSTAYRGRLVAVTGSGGTGQSTVAMALAQHLASDPRHHAMVCLADLALNADLALLHDAGDVVPGVVELVEAHRAGRPSADTVRGLTWWAPDRGYHLLLGLRRHRDWTSLRRRSVEAAIDSLRRSFRIVVADVDPDLEGELQTGSFDVEERNALARLTIESASLVCVVGAPGVQGVHSMLRVIRDVIAHGTPPDAIVPLVNRAPRRARDRAQVTHAVRHLLGSDLARAEGLLAPVHLAMQRRLELDVRDGRAGGSSWVAPLTKVVQARLEQLEESPRTVDLVEPVPVAPGSLGVWTDLDFPDGGGISE